MSADGNNAFPCTIELVEPIGSEMYIHLKAGELSLVATVKSDYSVRPGQTLMIRLNAAKLHLFDPKSQYNLIRPE
ncbi:TOBE domain-containing protein [Syntrophomonas palmitatica]|uniref:TOBE domain-containing protein n=1 Tax=Syntrophomonas palmitatica TaxID=402877 RepID=UPI003F6ECC75